MKIIEIIVVFLLCFINHNVYKWFPNNFTLIFFPINESILEHMKIILVSSLEYSLFQYTFLAKSNVLYHNFWSSSILSAILSIPIYLSLFLPLYFMLGHQFIITISLMLLVIIIIVKIKYLLMKKDESKYLTFISSILLIILFIVFGYFSYNPI
ncbi:MAG: DUF6512 family protein [Bacilli bacterium]